MKKHKRRAKYTIFEYLLIFVSIITVIVVLYVIIETQQTAVHKFAENTIMPLCISVTVSQLIALILHRTENKKDSTCPYQLHLEELGIERIYINRENDHNESSYISDLLTDLNKLEKRTSMVDCVVKMIGVSLEFYFHYDNNRKCVDIAKRITNMKAAIKSKFQILICNNENELRLRDFYSNMIKDNGQVPIHVAEDNIETQKILKQYAIPYKCYKSAPYATIVIINKHVYYSPNTAIAKKISIGKIRSDGNSDTVNLTFRIC